MIERALGVVRFRLPRIASPPLAWVPLPRRPGRAGRRLGTREPRRRTAHAIVVLRLPGCDQPLRPSPLDLWRLGQRKQPELRPDADKGDRTASPRAPRRARSAAGWRPLDGERDSQDQGDGPGLSRCEHQRPLLHAGPARRVERQAALAGSSRRDRDGTGGGQPSRFPRRTSDSLRLLRRCTAEQSGVRDQRCRACDPGESQDRRPRVIELRDRRGRRRHSPDVRRFDARVHPGGARAQRGRVLRCRHVWHHDGRRDKNGARRRARVDRAHPSSRPVQ